MSYLYFNFVFTAICLIEAKLDSKNEITWQEADFLLPSNLHFSSTCPVSFLPEQVVGQENASEMLL